MIHIFLVRGICSFANVLFANNRSRFGHIVGLVLQWTFDKKKICRWITIALDVAIMSTIWKPRGLILGEKAQGGSGIPIIPCWILENMVNEVNDPTQAG